MLGVNRLTALKQTPLFLGLSLGCAPPWFLAAVLIYPLGNLEKL
jgi:hypothetical protein